jgi:hypothetical protein
MKKWLLLFSLVVVVLASPAAYACESCVPKGTKDPDGGGPYNNAICWTHDEGLYSYCWGGDVTCGGYGDPENSCPLKEPVCADEFDPKCLPILEVQWEDSVSGVAAAAQENCSVDVARRCEDGPARRLTFVL